MLLQFKIIVFLNLFSDLVYLCDAKRNFQHHWFGLQCHMMLQKSF